VGEPGPKGEVAGAAIAGYAVDPRLLREQVCAEGVREIPKDFAFAKGMT
jgi:hypothetical protein